MTAPAELRPVITYPRDAILDRNQVAAAIGVDVDVVSKMDLPCFYPAIRKPRFIWGQVLDVLAERASPNSQPAAVSKTRGRKSA